MCGIGICPLTYQKEATCNNNNDDSNNKNNNSNNNSNNSNDSYNCNKNIIILAIYAN